MHRFEAILVMLDRSLNTKKKRHIVGGILLSVSILFGGLAFTVMTVKMEENNHEEWDKV